MRRVALLSMLALLVGACVDAPYAELRQRSSQPIPGTLSASLEPPGEADPRLDPSAAIESAPLPDGADVEIALARVRDAIEGLDVGPAWVLVARGVCIREDKGELVSDARGDVPGDDLACTRSTFLLVAIDAATGASLLTITGYDETLAWRPDVAGLA
ncbi:MAG TPA: hypothetical protein VLA82_10690 [Actinomycetota bacterium]|nr:hypothetical protein [Actinomycetota bacterium]